MIKGKSSLQQLITILGLFTLMLIPVLGISMLVNSCLKVSRGEY